MALFSDIDWAIILVVAAFLLFGPENRAVVRQLGRYYARAMRMRQELLSEVTAAADLPVAAGGGGTLRSALLGDTPADGPARASVPIAVTRAPVLTAPPSGSAWTGQIGEELWSVATTGPGPEVRYR